MRDIIFYDFQFNRLGDFPMPVSVNIEKCYCGYGAAELHFAADNQEIIRILESNDYLFFIVGEGCGIVTGWQAGEDIAVYGRTPEWLLTKRGVEAFSVSDSTAEEVVRRMVSGTEDFVALGELSNVGTETDYSTGDVRLLYDVVCDVLKSQNLGFEVCPDIEGKKFVFRVYEGKSSLCIFSPSNRTAYNMEYTADRQAMATNSGWYKRRYKDMGGWDAKTNQPGLANNNPENAYTFYKITSEDYASSGNYVIQFGLQCRKGTYLYCDNEQGTWKISETKPDTIWLYIDNPEKSGLYKWDAVLSGLKTCEEATAELAQRVKREDTSCETYRYEYGTDYNLGDTVRVQFEFGDFKKTEKKRVTAVNIYYDTDSWGATPILNGLEG